MPLVEVQITGSIVKITANGPYYNALSTPLLEELTRVLQSIEGEFPKYSCIILTGSKNHFSAGASIKEFAETGKDIFIPRYERVSEFFYQYLPRYPIPVIAAVDGSCFGGGFELALSSDFILTTETAALGLPETTLGILPGFGGTQRLTQIVGKYIAMEMILAHRFISGEEAVKLGIANSCHADNDELQEAALHLAKRLSKGSKYAARSAKLSINHQLELEQGSRFERDQFIELFQGGDKKEGVNAFLQKRRAKF